MVEPVAGAIALTLATEPISLLDTAVLPMHPPSPILAPHDRIAVGAYRTAPTTQPGSERPALKTW